MIEIREFRDSDSPEIARIMNEAFGDEIERGMQKFEAEGFSKRAEFKHVNQFVATSDGVVAGYLLLTGPREGAPPQIHLVAVDEGIRGEGIGGMLVDSAIERFRGMGEAKLKLFTRPWNTPMRRICEKKDFTEEAYLRKDYLGEDLILYSLFVD